MPAGRSEERANSVRPSLAVAWRTINDTTWEFKLRPGVTFSNGAAFTANDVIYSVCRAPRVENSPSSFGLYVRAIAGMTAPNLLFAGSGPLYPDPEGNDVKEGIPWSTVTGIAGWWTQQVSGAGGQGGELTLGFPVLSSGSMVASSNAYGLARAG